MNDEFMEEYARIAEVYRTCCTNYGVEDRPSCDECPYSDLIIKSLASKLSIGEVMFCDYTECKTALCTRVYEMMDELILALGHARQIEKRSNEIISELGDKVRRNGWIPVPFSVIDKKTGKYPDLEKIALEEDWAQCLMYCDMEGFALEEDGTLLLLDECGRQACCPPDRFEIVTEEEAWND